MPLRRLPRCLLPLALLGLAGCAALPFGSDDDATTEGGQPEVGLVDLPELEEDSDTAPLNAAAFINWRDHATHLLDESEEAAPEDIWERMRRGFAMPDRDEARIEPQRRWHERHPGYLDRVATRAEPFLHYIVEEIERRDLPMELALLPIVESGYDPFAYSHGRAAGMWQFIPSTGRHFGLKQNWWYDGRRDFIAATDAALTYLEQLAERFDGDWELAMAAYNGGGGTVSRAIRRNRQRGEAIDYWNLGLPRETMHYVPKLLALRDIIRDPGEYEVTLRPLANEPRLAVVELEGQIDLALAAELAEIDIDTLYRLNAGYNRWATDPDGPHRLVIPREQQDTFEAALSELGPNERISWTRHRIQSGESLNTIARRYNTTVALLQDVNELRGSTIRAGDHLLVPQSKADPAAYSGSQAERLSRIQSTQRGDREKVVHKVQSGESFWSISQRYDVNVRQLAQWNGMAPGDTLRAGQSLAVWVEDGARQGSLLSAGPSDRQRQVNYRVRSGDNLAAIAQRFGVSVSDLLRWNSVSADDYLQPGQQLTIRVDIRNTSGG